MTIRLSTHAQARAAQRCLSPEDIGSILIIVDKTRSTIITMWLNRQHGSRKLRRKRARAR